MISHFSRAFFHEFWCSKTMGPAFFFPVFFKSSECSWQVAGPLPFTALGRLRRSPKDLENPRISRLVRLGEWLGNGWENNYSPLGKPLIVHHNAAHLISLTINWTINGWEKPEIVQPLIVIMDYCYWWLKYHEWLLINITNDGNDGIDSPLIVCLWIWWLGYDDSGIFQWD